MATSFDLSSLRGKITSAYITLVISTAVLGVFAFSDLLFLQRQVNQDEVVSKLKDAVLEMRRVEKNLFLYDDSKSYAMLDTQAALVLRILQQHEDSLNAIQAEPAVLSMKEIVADYRQRLERWQASAESGNTALPREMRTLGHKLSFYTTTLSSLARSRLEMAVKKSQWFLLLTLLIIGISILFVGRQLKRVVLKPIKQLESRLEKISGGTFNKIDPPSDDREFITLTNAFNRMIKELEIRQRRMMQSEKLASLGILAAGVAHELNNPLSNISSSCQLLLEELEEGDPAQLKTWLKQIDSETERGRNIVRSLLEFGSKQNFQKRQLKLLDIIEETQTILGNLLRQRSASLTMNIPETLILHADKQRLQQLFINLIQNALQAGGEGAEVRISASLCERGVSMIPDGAEVAGDLKCVNDYDSSFIEILVSDNGPGIPADNLSKIFDPFFTTNEPGYGAGLGLYIVQEIMQEHDGCLAIASRPGKGTQVILLLPVEEVES